MTYQIHPILLCGGSGSRLWPFSRKTYPKQFLKLIGDESLFQQTAIRTSYSEALNFTDPTLVTSNDFRFLVREQLAAIGIMTNEILIEPEPKNTAIAILAACIYKAKTDPKAIMLVCPTDHVIHDVSAFHNAIQKGVHFALQGQIVTFGIKPTSPETGYGYLELPEYHDGEPVKIKRFIEKPNNQEALAMIEKENFLWNSGIFLFCAEEMIAAFEAYFPSIVEPVRAAVENGKADLNFYRLASETWVNCEAISIDYAVMEKTDNLIVVPVDMQWTDLGNWDAVRQESQPNRKGVVTSPSAIAVDCQNTLLVSDDDTAVLVGMGLDNIIAVAMKDAVLITTRAQAQNVGNIVTMLREKGIEQADYSLREVRSWGDFETFSESNTVRINKLVINPHSHVTMQTHQMRTEHWVVIEGSVNIIIEGEVFELSAGQSTYIAQGQMHKIENTSNERAELIEVQVGYYLKDDDITRYS